MNAHSSFSRVVLALLAAAASAQADVVVLYTGERLPGEIIGENEEEVSLRQESASLPGLAYIRKVRSLPGARG